MSKFRNRSIRTLPFIACQQDAKKEFITEDYFGENVCHEEVPSTLSSCDERLESIILNDRSNRDLSSSSSLSWSDFEYENASTQVQEELQRIDRVLKRLEPIPVEYDGDEFEQWMGNFPDLSIFDDKHKTKPKTKKPNETTESEDKTILKHAESNKPKNVQLKTTPVLNTLTTPYQIKKRHDPHDINNNRSTFKNDALDINNFLKISQIKQKQKQSAKPSIHAEAIEHDFISLPFLGDENNKRNIYSSHSQISKVNKTKKRQGNLVLPPISNNGQFRSISATPRKPVKSSYERGKQNNLKDISEYYHTLRKQSSRLFV